MTPRRHTRRTGSVLLSLFSFLLVADFLAGEQDDPSEIFLKAYLSAQQGANWRMKTGLRLPWPNTDLPEA